MTFELSDNKGETKTIEKKLYFPKLINGCYYLIKDVMYFPIFQIIDAETYRTNSSITMRTALQPIVVSYKNTTIKTVENEEIDGYYTFSKIFDTKIPIFIYFFANYGVNGTLKFLDLEEHFLILDKTRYDDFDSDNYYLFKLGSMLYLAADKEYVKESVNNKMMMITFLNAFLKKDKVSTDKLDDLNYWVKKLGSYFTKNPTNYDTKGKSVKLSFERLLDNTTKRIIRLSDRDKESVYTLLRWFLINYNDLLYQDNDDLANKKLRLNECFIFPLLKTWTDGVLRILNGKNITIKTLESLFSNITPDFLITKIKNDNLRYMNNVDSIDISNKLKLTISGNQSISNSKGEIKGKTLHPSLIGNIDLIFTSNNNPGETRCLTIGAKLNDTWHFSDEPNIKASSYDGEDEDINLNEEVLDEVDNIDEFF
jgi:hypothetical protein